MSDLDGVVTWVVGGGKQPTAGASEFGRLVRWLREELGLTATDLAATTGLSQGFLSGIEHGKQAPSEAYAKKLLTFFGDKGVLNVVSVEETSRGRGGSNRRPDFVITDPRSGDTIAIEVKAKRQGDNRAHFDQLAAYWSREDASLVASTPPGLRASLVPLNELGEDSLYGNVVRRLAQADRDRLVEIERYLDRLDREDGHAGHSDGGTK